MSRHTGSSPHKARVVEVRNTDNRQDVATAIAIVREGVRAHTIKNPAEFDHVAFH